VANSDPTPHVRSSPFTFLILTALAVAALAAAGASPQAPAQPPPSQAPAPVQPLPGAAGQATPQTPGTPPPAVPASRKFTSDGGMIINVIKPDKGPDFEAVMAKVKEALAKSDNPKRKQMALSWRVYKGLETGMGGNLVYIFWFDPPVKDEDYQITAILGEAFPNELQDLWSKFTQCFVNGQTMLNLQQVVNMSPNATAIPK
jgi:hypothetical protein